MHSLLKFCLFLAGLCAAALLVALVAGATAWAGPLLAASLILLAVGSRAGGVLRQFSFTLWIFAAVSLAMVRLGPLLAVGDFQLSRLIVPLVQVIMFVMGTAMSVKDFAGVLPMPKGVLVGTACQ